MTVSILSIHQARDSKLKLIKLSAGKEDPVYNLCAKRSARIEIRSDDDDDDPTLSSFLILAGPECRFFINEFFYKKNLSVNTQSG